jgi:hypothetical protein
VAWLLTHYVLDIWTAVHFAGWALATLWARRALTRAGAPGDPRTRAWTWRRCVLVAFLVGLGWEMLEPWTVEVWFGFREPLLNRFLSDPIADLLGAMVGAWLGRPTLPRSAELSSTARRAWTER